MPSIAVAWAVNREVNWVMGSSSFGYALEYLMIIAGPLWLNTKVTVMTVWFLCFHGEFTVSWDTETTTNASGCSSGAIINHNRHHHGRRHHRHHHARPCKRAVEYCTLQYPYNILCFISGGEMRFLLGTRYWFSPTDMLAIIQAMYITRTSAATCRVMDVTANGGQLLYIPPFLYGVQGAWNDGNLSV